MMKTKTTAPRQRLHADPLVTDILYLVVYYVDCLTKKLYKQLSAKPERNYFVHVNNS